SGSQNVPWRKQAIWIEFPLYCPHHRDLQRVHLQREPSPLDLSDSMFCGDRSSECDDVPQSLLYRLFYGSEFLPVPRHEILVRVAIPGVTVDYRLGKAVLRGNSTCSLYRVAKFRVRNSPIS